MVEVILTQHVQGIGSAGNVVKVKDGFARNYLLPNKLALPATPAGIRQLEQEKKKKAQHEEKTRKECLALKERLEALSITISALTQEQERLYGSVTGADIAAAVLEEGITIDKNSILLPEPIKALGIYEVPVQLHPEVPCKIKIWIVKK
jgi:large subunit ribosomal protein L9